MNPGHTIARIFTGIFFMFFLTACQESPLRIRPVDSKWQYAYLEQNDSLDDGELIWQDYDDAAPPAAHMPGGLIAFRTRFLTAPFETGVIMTTGEQLYFVALFADGKLLHKSGNSERPRIFSTAVLSLSTLPHGTQEFTILAKYLDYAPLTKPMLYTGNERRLLEYFAGFNFFQVLLSIFFISLALFTYSTYMTKRSDTYIGGIIWFAHLNLLLGINSLCNTNIALLYFPEYFWVLLVDMISYVLLPFAFLKFISLFLMHESALLKRSLTVLLYVLSGLAGYFMLSLFVFPNRYFRDVTDFYSLLIFLVTVVVLFETVRSMIQGNIRYKRVAWGLIIFFISILCDYLIRFLTVPVILHSIPILLSGYLIVVIILGSVLIRQFNEARAKLKLYTSQLEEMNRTLESRVHERTIQLEHEKEKSEMLLLNILPARVADDLKQNGRSEPEQFENVTVMFTDFAGFTEMSALMSPSQLIGTLNEIYSEFDRISARNGCVRIKTIGDAYLCVCGMPDPVSDHASRMVRNAWDILNYMKGFNTGRDIPWRIRIGIHSGKVVGGVVGITKFIYDVFGDTINTASRMESLAEPGSIHISDAVKTRIKGFDLTARGELDVKGKGLMRTWYVCGLQ